MHKNIYGVHVSYITNHRQHAGRPRQSFPSLSLSNISRKTEREKRKHVMSHFRSPTHTQQQPYVSYDAKKKKLLLRSPSVLPSVRMRSRLTLDTTFLKKKPRKAHARDGERPPWSTKIVAVIPLPPHQVQKYRKPTAYSIITIATHQFDEETTHH